MSFSARNRIRGWLHSGRRVKLIGALPVRFWRTCTVPLRYMHFLLRARVLITLFVVISVLVIAARVTPPVPFLPEPGDVRTILGTLLTAQAAIAALTLAVTLFMMQGVRVRRDVDDRMYREYVRRSWMREILWWSLLAVGVTGLLLLVEVFIGESGSPEANRPELRNFALAAGLAFFVNLVLAGSLFERAILHSRPDQWRALRRDVNKADVRESVQAFSRRARRALDTSLAGQADLSVLFPDQGEGSADEAVRALLDDARGAVSERRHQELRRSLDSVLELVKYAMDEIKTTHIRWGAPGSQPEWPPLRELSRNLYSFREDLVREGDREYIFELLRFDYMLTAEGKRERCGELFTVGLNGYRWNYQIANRIGGEEFRALLRDRFSLNVESFILGNEPTVAFPYAWEIIRHQEGLLSDAMHGGQPGDYDQLHKSFRARLKPIRFHWQADDWPTSEASRLYQLLEQGYRIALMGLAGRGLFLARTNRIADVNPYLEVARLAYPHLGQMADDLAQALSNDDSPGFSLWQEWETQDSVPYETFSISSERYPLLFFALRLMELASDTMPTFDLHGRAQRVLDWFVSNSESVVTYMRAELYPALEQRRELATEALRSAVHRDDVTEDYEIIGRRLSETRISNLKSEVHAAAFSGNSVERLFAGADASLYLPADATDAPEERLMEQLVGKAFLTDTPVGALTGYAPHSGDQWGRAHSGDVLVRLCEALEGAPTIVAPLETPATLLEGISQAIEELDEPGHAIVVLAGNWLDLTIGLNTENLEGYDAEWRLPESDRIGEVGRYRGHPILSAPDYGSRCMYVVDPARWGLFVRAKADGDEDLRFEIKPISIDRARELLTANPGILASEPDEGSRLRKLQTFVEVVIGARTGFRVSDSSRARRIIPVDQPDANSETPEA